MKSVRSKSSMTAAEGAERTRTAVRALSTPYTYERRSMWSGFWLYLTACTLTAAIIPFGYWAALGGLVFLGAWAWAGRRA